MRINETSNCGTFELDGVREFNPRDARHFMRELVEDLPDSVSLNGVREWVWPAYIIFSDVDTAGQRGPAFAAYIRANKLGRISSMPYRVNPNTDNRIRIWVWGLNRKKMIELYGRPDVDLNEED